MKNYLPPVPKYDEQDAKALSAYRYLGAMTLLDIDYWQGQSELPIGEYYEGIAKHLKDGTVFSKLDNDRKPIGYATWKVDDDDQKVVYLTRQSAPFGDHIQLQKSLKDKLPEGTMAMSINPRSSRKEQVVWRS